MEEQPDVKETATELVERAQDKTQEVREQARGLIREQTVTRSTQAGEKVQSIGQAIRQTSEQLRAQGEDVPARVMEQAAGRLDSVGSYLLSSDPDRILADAEDFARRNPWVVAAGAAFLGFAASRFMKASGERRYRASIVDLTAHEVEADEYEPRHLVGNAGTSSDRR
jgi:hypothetical protein